jgi:hypothetical protein
MIQEEMFGHMTFQFLMKNILMFDVVGHSKEQAFIYLDGLLDNCWTVASIERKGTCRFKY